MYKPGMVRQGKNLREPLQPPNQSVESEWWQMSDDIQLYHFSEGIGQNVVIVHGGPGYPYRHPWPGLKALTSDYRFHYYDQRGCGRSSRPFDRFEEKNRWQTIQTLEQTLGIGAQVADIERIRRILGDQKLILIGSSFGGLLATFYAAEFPERVESLVLVAPADLLVMPPPSGGLFEQVKQRLPAKMQTEYQEYLDEYFDFSGMFKKSEAEVAAINQRFTDFYEQVYARAEILNDESSVAELIPEQGEAGGWMVQAQYFSLGKRHDYREAVKAVEAPVLVIHGTEDIQTISASKSYAEALPNGKFVSIDAAGHFVYQEQAEEFGKVVGRWLKGEFKS
jgi:proline iminopeptidase